MDDPTREELFEHGVTNSEYRATLLLSIVQRIRELETRVASINAATKPSEISATVPNDQIWKLIGVLVNEGVWFIADPLYVRMQPTPDCWRVVVKKGCDLLDGYDRP